MKGLSRNIVTKRGRPTIVFGLLLLIFMLGMGLRLHNLDAGSLWLDEILTAVWSRLDLASLVIILQERSNDAPLLYLITRLSIVLFGDTDLVLRLPAMLFGSLSILLTYKVGEILWTRKEGVVGAFLLAVSAFHVRYSQEARHYALMAFLALLSLIFLLQALQENQKRLWIGFVVCTSLSLYNQYFAFLFLPAEVIFGAWMIAENCLSPKQEWRDTSSVRVSRTHPTPARQTLMSLASLALVGASFLVWIPTFWVQVTRRVEVIPADTPTVGLQSSLDFLNGAVIPAFTGSDDGVALLWLAVFLLGLTRCERKQIALLLLWMGFPFILLAVMQFNVPLQPRYVLFALPLYLLVIAKGVTTVGRWLRRPLGGTGLDGSWVPRLSTGIPMLALAALSVGPLKDYYLWEKEDWRGAARYLGNNVRPGDIVLADGRSSRPAGDAWRVSRCLSYYLGSDSLANPPVLRVEKGVWTYLGIVEQDGGQVWAALWRPNRSALPESVQQIARVDFADISIMRLREPSGDTLQDTTSMLQVLLELLPAEAHLDIHLALAETYLRTGRLEQARLELDMASQLQPRDADAAQDSADARAEFEKVSGALVDIERPVWRDVGRDVALLGYALRPESVSGGGTLSLTLWWHVLREMDRDHSVFIHIVDQHERIWAQHDELLVHGGDPTSSWLPGDTVKGQHDLQLPPDTPPGEYTVKIGVYYWETGERLPVWDQDGQRLPEDAIALDRVTVTR